MTDELSPAQAAARIGATTRSVQRWIATGILPARRVGGRWRVAIGAIDAVTQGPASSAGASGLPIRNLFIANRGEIAARISRTANRLGVRPVVPHVDGPDGLDLLDAAGVVDAARAAGADALHPGFGFLAESADFAERVVAAGITWVGPPADAIRTIGDKAAARRLAASLGVPIIAGHDDPEQSDARLIAAAKRIGVPLIVKPVAGGGGKGMRTIRDLADLPAAVAAARREARTAFGDDRLILERLIEGARHVEIQILFDEHGSGVHLGERDCSIQRRHQKILEEAPSPAVDPELRRRLGEWALALGRAAGYASAGTCEFLVTDAGEARFLEMNTRLQVEHRVTELVFGRDLVDDQLRIAAGEPLALDQAEIDAAMTGHAVEVRLYAEDAEAGFLPATGRVEALRWPTNVGVRVDAGIAVGDEVTGRFDPMLAKIIAHGTDRATALDRLAQALDETLILGLTTNLRFLRWLVAHPVVRRGEARIDTLAGIWPPDGTADASPIPAAAWSAAAAALTDRAGWRMNAASSILLATDGATRRVVVDSPAGGAVASAVENVRTGDVVHVDVGGRSVAFRPAPPPDADRTLDIERSLSGGDGPVTIVAPMPGVILGMHVAIGQQVEHGAPIVTLEAMKMEHTVASPVAGRVADIAVTVGGQVDRGAVIAVIEP